MLRAGWSLLILVLGLALVQGQAWAEDVFGLQWTTLDADEPPPPTGNPDVLVVLQSVDDPPFEAMTQTDATGHFFFGGVPPGTYTLTVPFPPSSFGGIVLKDRGPAPDPPLPMGQFPVPSGESRNVDLPFQQGVGPAFSDFFAPNVVAGGVTFRSGVPAYDGPVMERVQHENAPDTLAGVVGDLGFGTGIEVWLTPLDPPGDPVRGLYAAGESQDRRLFSFPDRPLQPGDRVAISVALDDPLLADWAPSFPTTVELVYDPSVGLPPVEFRFGRAEDVTGRVFVDRVPQDGLFGGLDRGLGGLPVHIRPLEDGWAQGAPRDTITADDGTFLFETMLQGYYAIEVETTPGAPPLVLARLVNWPYQPVPALFPISPTDPAARPCTQGDLHESLLVTNLWVGDDPGPLDVRARLKEAGHGHGLHGTIDEAALWFDGPFPGAQSGPNEVVRIEGVEVQDGWATVTVRLVAVSPLFPAGFFGNVPRKLEVRVNGESCRAEGTFRCECVRPGSSFPQEEGCFRVLDAVSWEEWNAAVPPPPCTLESDDEVGGTNRLDLRVEVAPHVKPHDSGHDLELHLDLHASKGVHDRVLLVVPSGGWAGTATGERGILTVTRVQPTDHGSWEVEFSLQAPDRPDGNPGGLPLGSGRFDLELGGAHAHAELRHLNETRDPKPHEKRSRSAVEVLSFQSVADAGSCRRGGG